MTKPGGRRRTPLRLSVCDRFAPRTDRRFVQRVVAAALAEVRRPELSVALLLTDDAELTALHGVHLGDRSPTDVITFVDADHADIAISVECARRVARGLGHTIRAELALYIVHGILHASGYDDVHVRARQRMRAAEQRILAALGLRVTQVDP